MFLLGRGLMPALRKPSESRGLIAMVFLSALCIGGFYATSLTWGRHTHYAMIEYWRWWLVHLWVEGFFEVFATAVIALLFTRLGLIRAARQPPSSSETIVFLFGGILGTLHHLYFTGTPVRDRHRRDVLRPGWCPWPGGHGSVAQLPAFQGCALGAVTAGPSCASSPWASGTRSVPACWAFHQHATGAVLHAGLNMTAAHGHAALFGVYGMLGIGLMLFCLRGLLALGAWSGPPVGRHVLAAQRRAWR